MAVGEISKRLGLSRQRVDQLTHDPSFPEPYDELIAARIWQASDIEAWIAEHRPHLARDED